jgi:hypothetical protein
MADRERIEVRYKEVRRETKGRWKGHKWMMEETQS